MKNGSGKRSFPMLIGYKIAIGYAALLLVVGAFLYVLSNAIEDLRHEIEVITSRDLRIQEITYKMDKNVTDMELTRRHYMMTGDEASLSAYGEALRDWKLNEELLLALFAGMDDRLARLKSVGAAIVQRVAYVETFFLPDETRAAQDTIALLTDPGGQRQMDGMREQLSRLRQSEKYEMEQRLKVMEESQSSLQKLIFLLLAVASALTALFAWIVSRSVTRNVRRVTAAVSDIAEARGDLTRRVEVKTRDEMRELGDATNALLSSMQYMIGDIQQRTTRLFGVSENIGKSAEASVEMNSQVMMAVQRVAAGAEVQVSHSEEIRAIMEQSVDGLNQAAVTTRQAAESAVAARYAAGSGEARLEAAQTEMGRLERTFGTMQQSVARLSNQSGQIKSIAVYIEELSAQTNLLALNAAIEAARAGEHGRGFHVVSGEIRKLANLSSTSALRISDMVMQLNGCVEELVKLIGGSAETVQTGAAALQQAGAFAREAAGSVEELTERMLNVAKRVEQISDESSGIGQSAANIGMVSEEHSSFAEQMSAMAQEQHAAFLRFAASSEELNELSSLLQQQIGHFKV